MAFLVGSCGGSDGGPQPAISGQVRLFDEIGAGLGSSGGVMVVAIGASSTDTTVTSDDGRFELTDADAGPYDLEFSLDGFGTQRRFGIAADLPPLDVSLYERPQVDILGFSAEARDCDGGCVPFARLWIRMSAAEFFPPGRYRRLFRLFGGQAPAVSSESYERTLLLVVGNDDPGLSVLGDTIEWNSGSTYGLELEQYMSGTTFHLLLHGASENLSNSYIDPRSGTEVFTDLSVSSAPSSVVIP